MESVLPLEIVVAVMRRGCPLARDRVGPLLCLGSCQGIYGGLEGRELKIYDWFHRIQTDGIFYEHPYIGIMVRILSTLITAGPRWDVDMVGMYMDAYAGTMFVVWPMYPAKGHVNSIQQEMATSIQNKLAIMEGVCLIDEKIITWPFGIPELTFTYEGGYSFACNRTGLLVSEKGIVLSRSGCVPVLLTDPLLVLNQMLTPSFLWPRLGV